MLGRRPSMLGEVSALAHARIGSSCLGNSGLLETPAWCYNEERVGA
jgi:hypothetical protein